MTSHQLFGRDAEPVRVVGIDPGSTLHGLALLHVGACKAELGTPPTCLLHGATDDVISFLRAQPAGTLVAVETAVGVHSGIAKKRGVRAALGIAAASAAATREAGVIEGTARALGHRVERCQAVEWRKALIGNAQASDAEIARVVPRLVHGWPKKSSAHHRDAAGVAIYVARRTMLAGRVA